MPTAHASSRFFPTSSTTRRSSPPPASASRSRSTARESGQGRARARALQPAGGRRQPAQRMAGVRAPRAPQPGAGREAGVDRCRPRTHRADSFQPPRQRGEVHPRRQAHHGRGRPRGRVGEVALERERFNLLEVVANLLNVWRASGRLERHNLVLDVKPVWIDAGRARIEQILSNLLDSAVKFTPAGKRITVAVDREGEWALMRVSDEGEGLPAESTERIFELFVQGERGLDRGAGGLGVGLALVKRLTEMHGGTVSATSGGRGQGAIFTVQLPAVEPSASSLVDEAAPRVAPRRVLIVEDNDDARQMLHEALIFGGHDVREARDGASGLALAAECRPDVALIDIGLPDLDGYEVARRLRAAPGGRRMGLIAITGYGQAEDQRRAYEAGFDAHLTKPVAPERLKQVMAGLQ